MSTMKIKAGDTVRVIAGKDKDKEGKVIAVNKKDGKVLVEGVNMPVSYTHLDVYKRQAKAVPITDSATISGQSRSRAGSGSIPEKISGLRQVPAHSSRMNWESIS